LHRTEEKIFFANVKETTYCDATVQNQTIFLFFRVFDKKKTKRKTMWVQKKKSHQYQ